MKEKLHFQISNILSDDIIDDQSDFIPLIADDSDDTEQFGEELPDELPLLPLRNTVLFPGVILPITVGREKSVKLVKDNYKKTKFIGTVSQLDPNIDDPIIKDLHRVGTVGQILKVLQMPDETTSVIIQGKGRIKIDEIVSDEPYFKGKVTPLPEIRPDHELEEFEAIVSSIKDLSLKVIQFSSNVPPEASFALKNIENPNFLINYICSNTDIPVAEKQKLLTIDSLRDRGLQLLEILSQEVQKLQLKQDIQAKVKSEIDQQQREFLLNQQMKTIQDELGGSPFEQELEDFKKKAADKKWTDEVKLVFNKEMDKLQRMNAASAEYSVQLNYIETLLELPWNEFSKDNFDLKRAEKILEEDHYGLEKVKERILEHLAVLKLKGDMKSPILCLYGPPGVGKTSLGKSVARALDRKYVRVSLGGLKDESEIRGHRKTYIGAMPGRIIQNIKKVKTSNPIFILDEIDKVGNDFRGDPSSALLEVLDPEQNSSFHDNYLEVDYDLSKVMFIATANDIQSVSPALLDRMELIEISGYIPEEKVQIAKRHLVRNQLKEHGLTEKDVKISEKCIDYITEYHTKESGVRTLDKKLAKLIRVIAKRKAFGEEINRNLSVEDVKDILGAPEVINDKYQGNDIAGVVTGLAWTARGGQILFIESSLSPGKGNITMTGNLGDVMKESATLAFEFIRSNSEQLKISKEALENWKVHIHVPEGAIPKDGPSAGITMLTSLASSFTQRKIRKNVAMTGEITLRGKLLPVGGIKEKILAAKRANIKDVILSEANRKDIEEIKDIYLKGLNFHYFDKAIGVLDYVLLKEKVKNPVKII